MIRYAIITDNSVQGLEDYSHTDVDLYTIEFSKKRQINQKYFYEIGGGFFETKDSQVIDKLPSLDSVQELFKSINSNYDEVFCILSAECITHLHDSIQEITKNNHSRANFHLIDSQSLSGGLGYLVNLTIRMIHQKNNPREIEATLREKIPNIYTLLCSGNLSTLYLSGFIDAGQLILGEHHSIIPLFSLENGQVNSLEKFKNYQGLLEYIAEFLEEYEKIDQLVLIHPAKSNSPFFQEIKQFSVQNNEINSWLELKSNDFLTNLIGSDGFGLILVE